MIEDLQKKYLDPIFQKLTEEEAHNLSFQDVVSAYDELKNEYKARAVGAKDIIAEVFSKLHSVINDTIIIIIIIIIIFIFIFINIIIIVIIISSIGRSALTLPLELSSS